MTNEWLKIRDKINEAEQHITQLEELKNILEHWESVRIRFSEDTDMFKKNVDALNFAIDFIKWGMK